MSMNIIACDPGILGGLILYEKDVITKTLRMPLIKEVTKNKEGKKQTKNHLDGKRILQFLKECLEVTTTVVIESQRIGSNDGYKSNIENGFINTYSSMLISINNI